MPLIKVKEIKVICNIIEDMERERRNKVVFINGKVDKENPVCPICNEEMKSSYGMYNGSVCNDSDEDEYYSMWSFECKNFHKCSWTEEVNHDSRTE